MASLLPDGRIVVGGGFNQYGDVGCENPNLRIFTPSYYDATNRPTLTSTSRLERIILGQTDVTLTYEGRRRLDPTRGVALLAAQAFTHSYGQNQRYVRMEITSLSDSSVTFDVPDSPVLLTGPYHLFLLNEDGVPSVASSILVVRDDGGDSKHSNSDSSRTFWVVFGVISAVVLLLGIVYIVITAQHGLEEEVLEAENMAISHMGLTYDDDDDDDDSSPTKANDLL